MSAMTDEQLDELREKREELKRLSTRVVDWMDGMGGSRKLVRQYEAACDEFGHHGLALLETVDVLLAKLARVYAITGESCAEDSRGTLLVKVAKVRSLSAPHTDVSLERNSDVHG